MDRLIDSMDDARKIAQVNYVVATSALFGLGVLEFFGNAPGSKVGLLLGALVYALGTANLLTVLHSS